MKHTAKKLVCLVLAAALVFSFAGCSSSSGSSTAASGTAAGSTSASASEASYDTGATVTYAMQAGWDSLVPFYWSTAGYYGTLVWDKLYDTLVSRAADGTFDPRGALSWEIDDTKTVMTFHLDPDAKFSDGKSVTAQDWVWTANLLANPDFAAPDCAKLCMLWTGTDDTGKLVSGETLGVSAPDDKTLQLTFKNPITFTTFFSTYNHFFYVLPQHCFEGVAAADVLASDFWKAPVGSGPFTVSSELVNSQLELVPNTYHAGGVPQFAKLVMTVMSPDNFASALMSGEIDICYPSLSTTEAKALANTEGLTVEQNKNPTYLWHMSINEEVVPDARVRQAMNLAIDKSLIAEQLFEGDATPAATIEIPGSDIDNSNLSAKQDVDAAKALLAEAGWDSSKTLKMATPSGVREKIATIVQQNLAAVGINVEVETVDIGTMFAGLNKGTYDLGMVGGSPSFDPLYMNNNWDYRSTTFYRVSDKTYMDLAQKIILSSDDAAAYKTAVDAYTQYLYDQGTLVPIVFQYSSAVYNSRIQGYDAFAANRDYDNVCDWKILAQ